MKRHRRELRKLAKKQFRSYVEEICQNASNLWTAGPPPKVIKEIAKCVGRKAPKLKRCNTNKSNSASMKDNNEKWGRTTKEKIRIHTNFYREIFTRADPELSAIQNEKSAEKIRRNFQNR